MLVLPGRFPTRCQATGPRGPVGWGVSEEVLNVPCASRLELFGFARGVIWVVGVFVFGYIFLLDLRGLRPPGVVGLRALDNPAWFGVRITGIPGALGLGNDISSAAPRDLPGSLLSGGFEGVDVDVVRLPAPLPH